MPGDRRNWQSNWRPWKFIPGTASWNDSSNNKAFVSGELHLTSNGISVYVAAQKDNKPVAVLCDGGSQGLRGEAREKFIPGRFIQGSVCSNSQSVNNSVTRSVR